MCADWVRGSVPASSVSASLSLHVSDCLWSRSVCESIPVPALYTPAPVTPACLSAHARPPQSECVCAAAPALRVGVYV